MVIGAPRGIRYVGVVQADASERHVVPGVMTNEQPYVSHARHDGNEASETRYYMGIIDILQTWTAKASPALSGMNFREFR